MESVLIVSEHRADWSRLSAKLESGAVSGISFITPYGSIEGCCEWLQNDFHIYYIPYGGKGTSLDLISSGPAIAWIIKNKNITKALFFNIVGALNNLLDVGDVVIVDDIYDDTKKRYRSFLELEDLQIIYHHRMNEVFCQRLRESLYDAGKEISRKLGSNLFSNGVYYCSEGPRYETAAEIRCYQQRGGDVVGHILVPHVYMTRELGVCMASACIVSNLGEGMNKRRLEEKSLSVEGDGLPGLLAEFMIQTIQHMTKNVKGECICKSDEVWVTRPKKYDKSI